MRKKACAAVMEEGIFDFKKQTSRNQGEPDTWPKGATGPTNHFLFSLPENQGYSQLLRFYLINLSSAFPFGQSGKPISEERGSSHQGSDISSVKAEQQHVQPLP